MGNTQQDIEVLFLSSLNIYPWEAPRQTFLTWEGIGVGQGKARPVASVSLRKITHSSNGKLSLFQWILLKEEIKPVNPKGNQPLIFTARTDAEAKAPVLWPHDAKSWLIGKDPDVGKDWGQEEKGATEDEMVGWYHQFSEHGFDQTLGDGEGQGSLACCSPCGCKESDTT